MDAQQPEPGFEDHAERMERVRLALDGLSIGDAFGSQFFVPSNQKYLFGPRREVPVGEWHYTDDTEMALGIAEVLERYGTIHQDELAHVFARRFQREMYRGYGPGAIRLLAAIANGEPWEPASRAAFGGQGSLGNGSAMRVAPVGAYFADDLAQVIVEAQRSAEVTHPHPEGVAGGVAVAVATAFAWSVRDRAGVDGVARELFDVVIALTPDGETRRGIEHAASIERDLSIDAAARLLGNGSQITCPDTVPFCIWVAARHLHNYRDALWSVVHAGGDIDTTGAIVGGIVAMAVGPSGIPGDWLAFREPLQYHIE